MVTVMISKTTTWHLGIDATFAKSPFTGMQLYLKMAQTLALVRSLFWRSKLVELQITQSAKWIIISIYIECNEVGAGTIIPFLQLG